MTPTPQEAKELDYELRKLFKSYAVGVSAGMMATRPKTVDDANEHLEAVITQAKALITKATEDLLDKVDKEVIGDDPQFLEDGSLNPMPYETHNIREALRQEQRERLNRIRGK